MIAVVTTVLWPFSLSAKAGTIFIMLSSNRHDTASLCDPEVCAGFLTQHIFSSGYWSTCELHPI
jgi:hypothetical protein